MNRERSACKEVKVRMKDDDEQLQRMKSLEEMDAFCL